MTYLSPEQTANRLGVSKRTLLERICKQPHFPARYTLTRKRFFWRAEDIDNYIASCAENTPPTF